MILKFLSLEKIYKLQKKYTIAKYNHDTVAHYKKLSNLIGNASLALCCIFPDNEITWPVFLLMSKEDLKELVRVLGTVIQLQQLQKKYVSVV